ncbi:MAG: putative extracellular protein [Rhodobacteraceae bacterium HLUCCA08]|nr:MAG: putative extracellular protein [Rhodobacteraceae bacterium HLUCCA08]
MRILFPLVASVMLASGAGAATMTLDFSGDICNGGGSCGSGSQIDQSYGDVAGQVDVIHDADRSLPGLQDLRHWGPGYETLDHVAYGLLNGGGLSILFDALAGYEVTVHGFDIAPYADRERDTLVQVIDMMDGTKLVYETYTPLSTAGITSFSGTWTSAAGIQINLGPDAWDIGISNIEYSVAPTQVTGPAAVPLPAAGWMLIAGLGGLGLMRRRKTA